jgi:hypothetical protein
MSTLDLYTEQERQLLVALPYRIGLWISMSDETGGAEADEYERQALASLLHGFATDFCKSEFVEELMRETVAKTDQWPAWSNNINAVLMEVKQALSLIREKQEYNDVESFRTSLGEIAESVALAFREYDDDPNFFERCSVFMRYARERIKSRMKGQLPRPLEDFYNISAAEDQALKALANALGR